MPPKRIEIEIGNNLGTSPYKYKFDFNENSLEMQYFNLEKGCVG